MKSPFLLGGEQHPVSAETSVEDTHAVTVPERNFSLLSICSVGIVTGNTWAAIGGSIIVALYNGGPPGVIYEFIAVTLFYCFIAASLAELASAIPSSAGVYHWASLAGGTRYGRICGWYAGWWNMFAWSFASSSMSAIMGNICVSIWSIQHEDYVFQKWHVFIVYLIMTWMACLVVLFANRALPIVNNIGLLSVVLGLFISVLVCGIMPSTMGSGHARSAFVWSDWLNNSGYTSDGFVFIAGMLNGAYAIGTPDAVSHLAEEIPNPSRNIPLAIGAQMIIGFSSALVYLVALFYGITDVDAIFETSVNFPLAAIYQHATSSRSAATGLLVVILVPIFSACIAAYIAVGRTLWTLARDEATPFSAFLGYLHPSYKNPFNATLVAGIFTTCLGCIYVGSTTAFNAFVGSFVVLSTLSYLAAVLPFMLSGRFDRRTEGGMDPIEPGQFKMTRVVGYSVNLICCLYIVVTVVVYCFPYSLPVAVENMNYSCVITGGLTLGITLWWIHKRREYVRPAVVITDGILLVAEPVTGRDFGVSGKQPGA